MLSYLKELLTSNPFISSLDLSNRGITVLDPHSVQLLARFTELRRLDLSDNQLRRLPADLTPL